MEQELKSTLFLSIGKRIKAEKYREWIGESFKRFAQLNLTISEFRTLTNILMSKFRSGVVKDSSLWFAQAAGHTIETAEVNYSTFSFSSDTPDSRFDYFQKVSIAWHSLISQSEVMAKGLLRDAAVSAENNEGLEAKLIEISRATGAKLDYLSNLTEVALQTAIGSRKGICHMFFLSVLTIVSIRISTTGSHRRGRPWLVLETMVGRSLQE